MRSQTALLPTAAVLSIVAAACSSETTPSTSCAGTSCQCDAGIGGQAGGTVSPGGGTGGAGGGAGGEPAGGGLPDLQDCSLVPEPAVICPAIGEPFAPANPDFLSLVGNELQIAIAYEADLEHIAELYRQARVKNVRVMLNWRSVEAEQGTFDWQYEDMRIGVFPPRGIHPVGILDQIPSWASSCATEPSSSYCTPNDLEDLRTFAREAVRRYGAPGTGAISDWEVRVEIQPNNTALTKEQYVAELNAVYDTIKAEDPDARIWGPEVPFGNSSYAVEDSPIQYEWLEHTIANGQFDVFAIHYFGSNTDVIAYHHTARIRGMLDAAGFEDIPIAVSATAKTNPTGTQQAQAQNLRDVYACIAAGGGDYAFWFSGTEWNADVALIPDDVTFGVLDYDFDLPTKVKPKLAYEALAQLGCMSEGP